MMRFPWLRVVACLVVAVLASGVTALIMLPAAWITPVFAQATGQRILLADPQGSLWHGSAQLMLSAGADANGATLMPYRFEWHTAPWPLLTGRLRMTMRESRPLSEPIVIDAQLSGATLSAGGMAVPASVLSGLGMPFNTLALEGDVRLEWTDWRLIGDKAYGQLVVVVRDVGSSVSRLKPLGSYRATVVATGQGANVTLATLAGPLSLTGSGQVQGGRVHFVGLAKSTPEARPNLAGLLNLLGRRIDENTNSLDFDR